MVYNCRGRYEYGTGGAPLTRTSAGPEDNARDGRWDRGLPVVFTLVLTLAAALVLAGCGSGSGGSQPSGGGNDGREARSSDPSGPENAGGETAELGTPSLGREDAPVVLTEYSDYQ
jgi:hypothetical protein